MSFFKRRGSVQQNAPAPTNSTPKSTNSTTAGLTSPLVETGMKGIESLPEKKDGSDKFFGMENFGYTCYCNSVLQCLYYSKSFRDAIINYPPANTRKPRPRRTSVHGDAPHPFLVAMKQQAEKEAIENAESRNDDKRKKDKKKPPSAAQIAASNAATTVGNVVASALTGGVIGIANSNSLPLRGEDTATPEQKKKSALTVGPIINMDHSMNTYYGMKESLFTTLKDVFEAMVESRSRVGIVSPAKLIEVLKRQNEMFRSSMHQDAHEFFNFLLNEVVDNVEQHERELKEAGLIDSDATTKRVNELFKGLLTSETKCLTCENVSRRDEQFLDLSIDLEQHSSVTSCLRQFSASEMLCESNKFHCDCCGGLQEAEKRMKIKRMPRILALHLKRFKFTEDMQRNVKLFHRVVFPYHLRLFNTTDDVQDPDRIYELYSVVVHIGGGPYHGHYVSIVKTEHTGWVLYDDEMVEQVDDDYVTNFFGDKPGLACAYILFYQEISQDDYERERRYGTAKEETTLSMPVEGQTAVPIVQKAPVPSASALAVSPSTSTTAASSTPTSSASSTSSTHASDVQLLPNGQSPYDKKIGRQYSVSVSSTPTPMIQRTASAMEVKSKKEGGNTPGLSRFKSNSISQKPKFWRRDSASTMSSSKNK
ncbi:hypothetical protein V1512DRAFT_97214 [Lipomyces arxii]|uniref:uncharacterized protein n=1 Tax=Lipomyces arxii TaxID=56418 RepID=UPI0034CDEC3E